MWQLLQRGLRGESLVRRIECPSNGSSDRRQVRASHPSSSDWSIDGDGDGDGSMVAVTAAAAVVVVMTTVAGDGDVSAVALARNTVMVAAGTGSSPPTC